MFNQNFPLKIKIQAISSGGGEGISKYKYLEIKYWPAPPTIHRGLEWPQFLNSLFSVCLFVCLLSVGKFSNFFVQYKAAGVGKNVVRMNTYVLIYCFQPLSFYGNI